MSSLEPAFTVQEVTMQEWAMAAFHAARAPQRVRVTVKQSHLPRNKAKAWGLPASGCG